MVSVAVDAGWRDEPSAWSRSRANAGRAQYRRRRSTPSAAVSLDAHGGAVVIDAWIETAKELGRPVPEPKGRRLGFA